MAFTQLLKQSKTHQNNSLVPRLGMINLPWPKSRRNNLS